MAYKVRRSFINRAALLWVLLFRSFDRQAGLLTRDEDVFIESRGDAARKTAGGVIPSVKHFGIVNGDARGVVERDHRHVARENRLHLVDHLFARGDIHYGKLLVGERVKFGIGVTLRAREAFNFAATGEVAAQHVGVAA